MNRIESCKDKDGVICSLRAIQGHSGGIAVDPNSMGYFLISQQWKKHLYQRGLSWTYQSALEHGLIPGGKEKDKARQAVFLTLTNPSGNDPEEERAHGDLTVPQKGPSITSWKPTQNAVFWVRLSEAEDLGLEFWQTKSFAIMTYATIPGECIDRVTSDGGDGTLFEQLETPRPPRKAMLSKNWQCQQQHSTSGPDVPSFWEQRQKSEDYLKFKTVRNTSLKWTKQQATWSSLFPQWMRFTLMMSTSLRVHFQVRTRIIKLLNELKLVQRRFCLHEDPVMESMEFSQESTQAAQDMANVELIELRTS